MPIQISFNSLFPIPISLRPLIEGLCSIWRHLTEDPPFVGVTAVRLRFIGAGWMDGALAVAKSVSLPALIGRCQIAIEIENLLNLRHPLIAPLIGFVFPVESGGRGD
jgi:hypothetical protein